MGSHIDAAAFLAQRNVGNPPYIDTALPGASIDGALRDNSGDFDAEPAETVEPELLWRTPDPGVVDFTRPNAELMPGIFERAHWFGEWLINSFSLRGFLDCWPLHDDVTMMCYDLFLYHNETVNEPGARVRFYDTLSNFAGWLDKSTIKNCSETLHKPLIHPSTYQQREKYYRTALLNLKT